MYKILQILILIILSVLMISASCDKGAEGCTDLLACNYDDTAIIDDNSCWFVNDECSCDDPVNSFQDCLGICDTNPENNPPENEDGTCEDGVLELSGCIDPNSCNYDDVSLYNDGSCAFDLSGFGGTVAGCDCTNLNCNLNDAACNGPAVLDGCELIPNCLDHISHIGQSWKIKINSQVYIRSLDSDSLLTIDSNSVTIGASIYALDEYNGEVEQEGESTDFGDSCFIDIPEPPHSPAYNSSRFYFPHEDWINDFNNDNFVQDIRYNDYHRLFSIGMQWNAIIAPLNLTSNAIIDSLSISYENLHSVDYCTIEININDGLEEALYENEWKYFTVQTTEEVTLSFNISNICFKEID